MSVKDILIWPDDALEEEFVILKSAMYNSRRTKATIASENTLYCPSIC